MKSSWFWVLGSWLVMGAMMLCVAGACQADDLRLFEPVISAESSAKLDLFDAGVSLKLFEQPAAVSHDSCELDLFDCRGFTETARTEPAKDPEQPFWTAWIISLSACKPCDTFHNQRGDGLGGLKYRYLQIDKQQPDDVPDDVWKAAFDISRGKTVPFAMWRTGTQIPNLPAYVHKDDLFVLTHEQLMQYVKYSGTPDPPATGGHQTGVVSR